jgi:hypothetical protein
VEVRLSRERNLCRKSGKDIGRIHIYNFLTLATRVKIKYVKAMAQTFVLDSEDLFVLGYVSRPDLHVKPKNAGQRTMWLAFSIALLGYGSGLVASDL